MKTGPQLVVSYIAAAPPKARPMLRELRRIIKSAVPAAEERISYGMPYYHYHGRLAYFAAFRDHVSYFVMPGKATTDKYAAQLRPYMSGKATMKIPLGQKIPTALIRQLVLARAKVNVAARKKRK